MLKSPSYRQVLACELGHHDKRCRCRCHGLLHGLNRGTERAFFETLSPLDAHWIPSLELRRRRANKRRRERRRESRTEMRDLFAGLEAP